MSNNRMKKILAFTFLFFCSTSYAQPDLAGIAKEIVTEGQLLYRSELASWNGTDLFTKKYDHRDNIGGYLSYSDGDATKNIFFSKGAAPQVIGTITFEKTLNPRKAHLDLTERPFNAEERTLFIIRTKTLAALNSDTFFVRHDKTNLNVVPLIYNGEKKVYVLTAPTESGMLILGNDYLLMFDNDNIMVSKTRIHQSILWGRYDKGKGKSKRIVGGYHTHTPATGDFITATDICTIMLYQNLTRLRKYAVISANYVSTWDCDMEELTIKTVSDAKKRHK